MSSDNNEWFNGIKEKVQQKLGTNEEDEDDDVWTMFIQKVAIFLRSKKIGNKRIVSTITTLINLGIRTQEDLGEVSQIDDRNGRRDHRDHFAVNLEMRGVPLVLANNLFDRFVDPPRKEDHRTQMAAVDQPSISASAIADSQHHFLEHYCFPHPEDCYIPNSRLRDLQNLPTTTTIVHHDIQNLSGLKNLHTFAVNKVDEGNSCRLVLDHLFDCIKSRIKPPHTAQIVHSEMVQGYVDFRLVGSISKPEPVLVVDSVAVLASEAKNPNSSLMQCLPQACTLAGDIALGLRSRGADLDNCAVPAILSAGDSIQIAGAYLLHPSFPSFCLLSRPLNIYKHEDILELSAWMESLANFCINSRRMTRGTGTAQIGVNLAFNHIFLKPVRGGESNIQLHVSKHRVIGSVILACYRRLHDTIGSEHFLFPLGLVQIPSHTDTIAVELRKGMIDCIKRKMPQINQKEGDTKQLTPLLVYEFLDPEEGWTNMPPLLQDSARASYVESYKKNLQEAVDACTDAGVVMLDLRPANVMWRPLQNGKTEMRIIDFEHVLTAGSLISSDLVRNQDQDSRYNISTYRKEDEMYFAQVETNDYWLKLIEKFIDEGKEGETFSSFCDAKVDK